MILQKPTARDVFLAFCLLTLMGGCSFRSIEIGQVDPTPVLEVHTGKLNLFGGVVTFESFGFEFRIPGAKFGPVPEPKPQSIYDEVADGTD